MHLSFPLKSLALTVMISATALSASPAFSDTNAPILTRFSFEPRKIDTSREAKSIVVKLGLEDESPGFQFGDVGFKSTTSQQKLNKSFSVGQLVSGNANKGMYQLGIDFPQYSAPGTWEVDYVFLMDSGFNTRHYYKSELDSLGFTTELQQIGLGDTTAPTIESLKFSENKVNTQSGPVTVDATLLVADDLSGFVIGTIGLRNSSTEEVLNIGAYFNLDSMIKGNANKGAYLVKIVFPQNSVPGHWVINSIQLKDLTSNSVVYSEEQLANMGLQSTIVVQ